MYWKEMHVQVDTRLQRINSEAFDVFFQAEKDILLNYAQHKFIRNILPPNEGNRRQEGHQVTTKRYDDLQTLVTKKNLPMFYLEDNVLFSVLPYDFFDFITANSKLVNDCNGVSLAKSNGGLSLAFIPFVDNNTYSDFKWTITYSDATPDLVLAQRSDYPKLPILSSIDEKFLIHTFGMYEANRNDYDVKVYWERFGEIYKPNTFIFVTENLFAIDVTMTVTGVQSETSNFELQLYDKYDLVTGTVVKKETRLIDSQFVYSFLANPYQTTGADSPITELSTNRILLHHNNTFASNVIELVYYRKPKPINSYLDVSCEIHESRHDKIVDIAVEAAGAFIGNPRDVKTLLQFINKSHE